MRKDFLNKLFEEHKSAICFPKPTKIYTWCNQLLSTLFPVLSEKCAHSVDDIETLLVKSQEDFIELLKMMEPDFKISAVDIAGEFYDQLNKAPIKSAALREAQLSMLNGETVLEDNVVKFANGLDYFYLPARSRLIYIILFSCRCMAYISPELFLNCYIHKSIADKLLLAHFYVGLHRFCD